MKTVQVFNSVIPLTIEGDGSLPLLVIGPASLFQKNKMLPSEMRKIYTIYYVDIFSEKIKLSTDQIKSLTWENFFAVLDDIKRQLGIAKIALFAHSAMGILAYEYARRNPNQVSSLILVATSPIWTNTKKKNSEVFFKHNASQYKITQRENDEKKFSDKKSQNKREAFINQYVSRRTEFFFNPQSPLASEKMWGNIYHHMNLVSRYFSLLQGYRIEPNRGVPVPTFLALGMHDSSTPFFLWTDDLKKTVEKMYYFIFDQSGHYPMVEEPEQFMKQLEQFVDSHHPRSCCTLS